MNYKNNDENFLKTLMENQQLLDKKYNDEILKYQNIQTELEKEKALLLEIKEILPKDIESENQLDNEIKIIENKIVKVEKDLKDALDLLTNIQKSVAEKKEALLQNNRSLEKWTDIYNNKNNEGHIFIKIKNEGTETVKFKAGEAIAQGIFFKYLITKSDSDLGLERESDY